MMCPIGEGNKLLGFEDGLVDLCKKITRGSKQYVYNDAGQKYLDCVNISAHGEDNYIKLDYFICSF